MSDESADRVNARRLPGVTAGSLVFAALYLVLICGSAGAAVPDDLDLTRASAAWRRAMPVPNPHNDLPCVRCHVTGGVTFKVARQFGMRIPLITGEEISTPVCTQCHEVHAATHPVDFPVRRLADAVQRAGIFPLETRIETFNKLTCVSCHSVHFPHTAHRLLRGFSVDGRLAGGSFQSRLDFCRSCHGAEEIISLSGHRSATGEAGCHLCHAAGDSVGSAGTIKRGLNRACSTCHPEESGELAHYVEYNPFPTLSPVDRGGVASEPNRGGSTCATCHRHHRPRQEDPYFAAGFLAAVSRSFQVNPHRTTRFCLNCHTVSPPPPGTPGAVAPLVDEDVTTLCCRCHDRENALRMQHPLVASSRDTPVPAGWPMRKDGTLGCETCHLAGHGPRDDDNPRFLRGPDRQRNGFCFNCHYDDRGRRRNLHAEIALDRGCDACHEGPGSAAQQQAGKVGALRAEPNLLCLLCHAVPNHPASATHTVRPQPSAFVAIDRGLAPLTLGKITCHTCHDSHSADRYALFLRLNAGQQLVCSNCHPY